VSSGNNKSDLFLAYEQHGTNWLLFRRESLPYIEDKLIIELKRGKFPLLFAPLNCTLNEIESKIWIEPNLPKHNFEVPVEVL
jgi:hypothetical protein